MRAIIAASLGSIKIIFLAPNNCTQFLVTYQIEDYPAQQISLVRGDNGKWYFVLPPSPFGIPHSPIEIPQ